jgi:hypothetical protein
MKSHTDYTSTAQNLADALMVYGKSRSPEDFQKVARLQTDLCAMRRQELEPEKPDAAE